MSKANVLHVIDTLSVGGAEKLLVGVVNGLPQFHHHVVCLGSPGMLVADLPVNCKVSSLNFKGKLDLFRCVMALRKYIRRNHIEVVHSHLVMSTLVARLACPSNVPLFNTIHSLLGRRCFSRGKWVQRAIEKLTYKKRHHLIAVSEEVRKDYDQSIGIKGAYSVLHNFVDTRFFRPDFKRMSFNGTFRMVAVGSLKPAKNYNYLIDAFKQLPKGVHLDIYGDGPLKNELQAAIDKHQLNVRLCGVHSNMQEIIPKYDMFVMTSVFEGHPVALLEAMACGMPALVSDIPVLREATGGEAILCDLGKTSDIVDKIQAIANHEVDLDHYAKANFERVKQLSGKEAYMLNLSNMYNDSRAALKKDRRQPAQPVFRPVVPSAAS
jgi:glycosyltransferase involved in cell wall biosynthesis